MKFLQEGGVRDKAIQALMIGCSALTNKTLFSSRWGAGLAFTKSGTFLPPIDVIFSLRGAPIGGDAHAPRDRAP